LYIETGGTLDIKGLKTYDRGIKVLFTAGARNCSHHSEQTCSGANPASYPMGIQGYFFGGKAADT
jgi:hypothetical protein